jgi:fructokinase
MRVACVEGGGTSWAVAIVETESNEISNHTRFETETPEITLANVKLWLLNNMPFDGIGIASFGPIDANKSSATYGFITSTPKPGYVNNTL